MGPATYAVAPMIADEAFEVDCVHYKFHAIDLVSSVSKYRACADP